MPVFALKLFQQKPKRKIFFCIFIFDSQLNNGKATFLFEPSSIVWQKSSAIQYISVTLSLVIIAFLHVKGHKPTTSLLITKFTISYNSSNSRDIKVGVLIIISLVTR